MDGAESIAAANRELIVMPGEPAQHFSPLALGMIAVSIVSQREAARDGKVMSAVSKMAVPSVRQQVKCGGIKSGRDGITRETAGKRKTFQRVKFEIAVIKNLAAGIGKAHSARAGTRGNVLAQSKASFSSASQHCFCESASLPKRSLIQPHSRGQIFAELIYKPLSGINRAVS